MESLERGEGEGQFKAVTEAWFPNRAIGILQQIQLRKSRLEHERLFLVFILSCLFVYFDFFCNPIGVII